MTHSPDLTHEVLRLNPNCCYQSCAGCSSIRGLRDFQGRHPVDWKRRLIGSPRLVEVALQHDCAVRMAEGAHSLAMEREDPKCAECGAFEPQDFGHIWLCATCHAGMGACCSRSDEG